MRRLLLLAIPLSALALTAAGTSGSADLGAAGSSASCAKADLKTVSDGKITVGTDNPAYPPWFAGTPAKGSKWKVGDPTSGKGFESAVAYAVAKQLGFPKSQVVWQYVPFSKSYAPGAKSFDFDINEISYTPQRAKVVDFTKSYYDVNQAVVVNKGTPIASVRSIAGLRKYKLGAQLGTTSYNAIVNDIKPSSKPAVYDTNDKAVFSLKSKQIDGLVVDLPTAFYVTAVQVPNSKILGQLPAKPGGEHFGMVLKKGNPLTACINKALAKLKANGTLRSIQAHWLAKVTGAPVLR
jgi:polar amino acid transport system substrate-binding protein